MQFLHKKLKSEIKSKMFLCNITTDLNWEILTKDLVLLKNGMWLRMKNFNIMWVHLKI